MTSLKTKLYKHIKLPLIEKYRPDNINDILMDSFIKIKIEKIIKQKIIPNLIITGEPGTGKTSTVLCLAKKIFENNADENVLELNASDDRGLSIINNTIIPFCKKKINKLLYKVIILDEADSITQKAQNLLNSVISEYNDKNRFIFICNDYTKINESIQSNCMIIKFHKITIEKLYNKIESICIKENINYDEEGINHLLYVSNNNIRYCINNLECIFKSGLEIKKKYIYKLVDIPKPKYINNIIENSLSGNIKESIKIINLLFDKGYSSNDILLTFMKFLLDKNLNKNMKEVMRLKIYEIVSLIYIRVNDGIDTRLQLCGCISNIYLYLKKN
jgi:replication factor C subunit 2/4